MRFLSLALAASIPTFVSAANFTISVGKGGAVYTPATINAVVGDFVNFQFEGGNHTVTQSTFADPCTQPFNTTSGVAGFDSGFMFVDPNATTLHVWALEIKDTKPLWFFCARKGHCNGGMAGAINPPTTGNTFDAFKAKLATADSPSYGTTKPIGASGNTTTPPSIPGNPGYKVSGSITSVITLFGVLASMLL